MYVNVRVRFLELEQLRSSSVLIGFPYVRRGLDSRTDRIPTVAVISGRSKTYAEKLRQFVHYVSPIGAARQVIRFHIRNGSQAVHYGVINMGRLTQDVSRERVLGEAVRVCYKFVLESN